MPTLAGGGIGSGTVNSGGSAYRWSGTKTYIIRYRPKGLGRTGTRRFVKLGRHGDLTVEQARDQAKVILGQVAMGQDPAAEQIAKRQAFGEQKQSPTFQSVSELFLRDHVTLKRKPKTLESYKALFHNHVYERLGTRAVNLVTRQDIAKLHNSLASKPYTANRVQEVISSMYAFAAKQGLVPEGFNPARGIEKFKEEGRERYLTGEELQRLGAALSEAETIGIPWQTDESNPKAKHTPKHWKGQRELLDPDAVAAIRLLLFTGARLREVLNLKWDMVDLERGLLFLADSKTGRKTIILNSAALELLRALKQSATMEITRKIGGFVIRGQLPDRARADLNRPWQAIRRRADLEGVRLHDLRHTFASIGAGASLGLPVVGRLLGHSQAQTTARYAHLDTDPLRRAANVIGDQIAAQLGQARRSVFSPGK